MASNNRSSGTAALRYASALVELAAQQGILPRIEQDVADLRAMIANSSDLQMLIRSPLASATAQKDGFAALADAAKFSALTRNFLLTLAENRRAFDMDAVLKAVEASLSAQRGEVKADVVAANDLSASQRTALEDTLAKTIGRPVALNIKIDTDLIGGMIVTLGSLQIDDSVKSKLDRLAVTMKYRRDAA